jgi:catalase-peroxidase
VYTDRPGVLTNDFFVDLLDMTTEWRPTGTEHVYDGWDRQTGHVRSTGTAVDLVFGAHSRSEPSRRSTTATIPSRSS